MVAVIARNVTGFIGVPENVVRTTKDYVKTSITSHSVKHIIRLISISLMAYTTQMNLENLQLLSFSYH